MSTPESSKAPESITLSTGQARPTQSPETPWAQYAGVGLLLLTALAATAGVLAWRRATRQLLSNPREVYIRAMAAYQSRS
jgi:hypothetical protein